MLPHHASEQNHTQVLDLLALKWKQTKQNKEQPSFFWSPLAVYNRTKWGFLKEPLKGTAKQPCHQDTMQSSIKIKDITHIVKKAKDRQCRKSSLWQPEILVCIIRLSRLAEGSEPGSHWYFSRYWKSLYQCSVYKAFTVRRRIQIAEALWCTVGWYPLYPSLTAS